jgi:hypothetical protein
MQPAFHPAAHFYGMRCVRAVSAVDFFLEGHDDFYYNGRLLKKRQPLHVELPEVKRPYMVELNSCRANSSSRSHSGDDVGSRKRFAGCQRYRIDIYRTGSDMATLSTLAVAARTPLKLNRNFDSSVLRYKMSVEIGTPFTISAQTKDEAGTVGIEWIGDFNSSGHGGLGTQHGCYHRGFARRDEIWHVDAPKAVGYYRYRICAKAADENPNHTVFYNLTVKCIPSYSAKLKRIDLGKWTDHLETESGGHIEFDPDIQQYIVMVPQGLEKVHLKAVSEDDEAGIRFRLNEEKQNISDHGELPRGSAEMSIKMPDNSDLKQGQMPRWSHIVSIRVTSSDDANEEHYILTIKERVNTYANLKDIKIGDDTPCKLKPQFHENITEYTCTWWWQKENSSHEVKIGAIVPFMHDEKCRGCKLMLPDQRHDLHLSYVAEDVDMFTWRTGKKWWKSFYYGERHRIPVKVVSANLFTHKTYYVTMLRDCPWWMQTWLTRQIATSATWIALIMAATSITNLMALAKQVQFMSLTCEIEGVPTVYEDFAKSLKSFNFEVFNWIPFEQMGIPTKKTLIRWRQDVINSLKDRLGVEHATLLMQYCAARRTLSPLGDLLFPNELLECNP